jgi:hypothetical protein
MVKNTNDEAPHGGNVAYIAPPLVYRKRKIICYLAALLYNAIITHVPLVTALLSTS